MPTITVATTAAPGRIAPGSLVPRGSVDISTTTSTTYTTKPAPKEMPAAAVPASSRTRLITNDTSIRLLMTPTIAATARTLALTLPRADQARLLDATSALASDLPVIAIRNRPVASAISWAVRDWSCADRTCSASCPRMLPALLIDSASNWPDTRPVRPTQNRMNGTKNRNRRNAIALPSTDPADTRSRS